MKSDARQTEGLPLSSFDAKAVSLLTPTAKAEGAVAGTAVRLPAYNSNGIQVMAYQQTGAIADSGAIIGKIQSSLDGVTYTDAYTFPSQGANSFQSAIVTITGPYVKYVGTVTGGGSGTIITDAGMVY